jgi:16S rRNA (guanine966-N2)-methyltransferase
MKRGVRQLRIVGGSLRGRRLSFPDAVGLRPTPDRVRETLFNWLAPHIPGMRVLDLFAGSGALGFEAASRGASQVTLVESNRAAVVAMRETAVNFRLSTVRIEAQDALAFLRSATPGVHDVIFLDPPFESTLLVPALALIGSRNLLAPDGFCYVECPRQQELPPLPKTWVVHRSGQAGEVGYHLLHEPQSDLPRNI